MKNLLIIAPRFPPAQGGLADHSIRLAQALSPERAVTVLSSPGAIPAKDFSVRPEISNWQDAASILSAIERLAPQGDILWQYVPHMYGRGGVNLALPRIMATLRQRQHRQLVIAHELYADWSLWPQRCMYVAAHRWQWRQILRRADAIGISTETWLEQWRPKAGPPAPQFFLAPSPSNIPRVEVPPDHQAQWRRAHGWPPETRVLAYFGTLGAAKQIDWVLEGWQAAAADGKPTALVVIGGKPEVEVPAALKKFYKPLGFLPAEATSQALQAVDALALPFLDGVAERRTSFMAGLSHGCPCVTTISYNTGPTLRQAVFFQSAPGGNKAAFARAVTELMQDEPRRRKLSQAGRQAYEQHYDWPALKVKVLEALASIG